MKTYYIPTSTLNFNTILSTESISPKVFYELREFGIKRWISIEENNIDDVILLYDEAKSFSRDDSEQEDHPMLVAISSEEEFPQYSEGIYYSDHTIYLDPWHTYFVFFSEEHKHTALSLTNGMLDVKVLPLYHKRMKVKTYSEAFQHNPQWDDLLIKDKKIEIEEDNRINKLKGLLYGYYIGAYLSLSSNALDDLIAFRKVHAYLANCISNGEGSRIPIPDVEYYEGLIGNSPINHKFLSPKESLIVVQNGEVIVLKINGQNLATLFNKWVDHVFLKPQYGKSIIPSRENILNDILQVMNDYEDKQMVEQANKYLQQLQDQFDGIFTSKMSFNNGLVSALALVLLAGESWEKLLQVMQRNNLYDYRLVFAIYGCICGFADLYRTFTDYILECKDREYVSDVYSEFYGQLFGRQIDTNNVLSIPSNPVQGGNGKEESNQQNTELVGDRYKPICEFLEKKSSELKDIFVQKMKCASNFPTQKDEYDFILGLRKDLKGIGLQGKKEKKDEWETVIEYLKPNKPNKRKKGKQVLERPLFPFYNDPKAFSYIEALIPRESKKTIKDDLDWFQDDYNENRINTNNGKNPHGRYAKYSKDNKSVIENYRKDFMEKKETKNHNIEWKKPIYEKIDIDAVISRLNEIYK